MEHAERLEAVRAASVIIRPNGGLSDLITLAEHIARYIAAGLRPEQRDEETTHS